MDHKIEKILEQATQVYIENFPAEAWFERCIFVSWYCSLGNCTFCYRSTQKDKIVDPKMAKRKMASIVAEAMLCKGLGWELDFITGGFGVYSTEEMVEIAKNVSQAMGKKVWFNYGVFGDSALEKFKPYVEGICSSIETVNPKVQKEVVPGKNIQAYIEMLKKAKGFKKSLAIVIGIGETRDDIPILHKLIEETRLDRLTIFALHPIAGTPFKKGPDPEYYAEWIAKTRIAFPKLEIIAGVPSNLLDKAGLALRAGANAITKFPAIKLFGTEKAEFVEKQIEATGRKFRGTLTKLPEIDWQAEIKKLNVPQELKKEVDWKLKQYLKRMKNQY